MPLLPTYSVLGHGPTVLLLHGSGGGFRSFAPQLEMLASLGFRAVGWDMPGYGHSPPIEPYTFKGLAGSCVALVEALAPLTGGGPVALVGQGMGGMVALELALRRSDLVRQLVLVGTAAAVNAGDPDDPYARYAAQALDWIGQGKDMAEVAAIQVPRLVGPAALPAGVQLATWCLSQVHASTWRRALEALTSLDRRAALADIHVPTLLVGGALDRVAPPQSMARMAQAISGSHHVTLEGVGHLPHLESPDEFDELLLDFLRHARVWLH